MIQSDGRGHLLAVVNCQLPIAKAAADGQAWSLAIQSSNVAMRHDSMQQHLKHGKHVMAQLQFERVSVCEPLVNTQFALQHSHDTWSAPLYVSLNGFVDGKLLIQNVCVSPNIVNRSIYLSTHGQLPSCPLQFWMSE